MKITEIAVERLRLPLDPPFHAALGPGRPRHASRRVLVRVHTDEGITGVGSGEAMDGFDAYRHLFLGTDPLDIANQVRTIETANFHGASYWPLEAAFWDIIGQVTGQPVRCSSATRQAPARLRLHRGAAFGGLPRRVAAGLREHGFRAMKIRIDRTRLREGLDAVRRTREAVGAGLRDHGGP
jgi:D-galactarolactone cycloisomerase